jgi:hypothetical protein
MSYLSLGYEAHSSTCTLGDCNGIGVLGDITSFNCMDRCHSKTICEIRSKKYRLKMDMRIF